jgi:crossover junction endodeoxyribonuclease RusA
MTLVSFTVIGVAVPKGSLKAFVRDGRAHLTHDNPHTRSWSHLVAAQAQTVVRLDHVAQFLGPIAIRVTFALPRPPSLPRRVTAHTKKPDLDKLLRNVGDALRGVLYRDDNQIVEWHGRKVYAPVGAGELIDVEVPADEVPV